MISVVVNKNMEVSGSSASAFRNMAVWEGGYNICLEVCRAAENFSGNDSTLIAQLKSAATAVPLNLSKGASYKVGRRYVKHLREAFVSTKQLSTMLMLCHDLNYMSTQRFIDLNSKLHIFSTKLLKYIKYSERKIRRRQAK